MIGYSQAKYGNDKTIWTNYISQKWQQPHNFLHLNQFAYINSDYWLSLYLNKANVQMAWFLLESSLPANYRAAQHIKIQQANIKVIFAFFLILVSASKTTGARGKHQPELLFSIFILPFAGFLKQSLPWI